MVTKHNLDCFDEFTIRFILAKVRRLIGRAGLTTSDRPDLIQDFALDLLQRRVNFNPATGSWEAFVVVICENRAASILQHRQAQMRNHACEAPPLDGVESAPLRDDQHDRRTGQRHRSAEEAWDLHDDVVGVTDTLPPRLRKICMRLQDGATKTSVAGELGMSTGAFYEKVDLIRARFEKAGLREYLK